VGNTSSNGSESATPRSGREEVEAIPVEGSDSSEEDGSIAVRINWTEEENERLASAWIKHSVDSIDGNGKKATYYWKQVGDEFNSNRPVNGRKRTVKQMMNHWGTINKTIQHFNGVYSRASDTYVSGQCDKMLMDTARAMFKGENKEKPFTMEYLWEKFREQRKWKNLYARENNKRTKISASGEYTSSSNNQETEDERDKREKRPEGQKKAKDRAKGKGKLQHSEDKPSEDMLLFHDAIGKRSAALVQIAEASKERTKMQTYLNLLEKDTSMYNEAKLRRHEQVLDLLGKELFPESCCLCAK
jgi:hypothetical protein